MEARIKMMMPLLNEKQKRLYLASEAMTYGRGGIAKVQRISGASKNTIRRGIAEHKNSINSEEDKNMAKAFTFCIEWGKIAI